SSYRYRKLLRLSDFRFQESKMKLLIITQTIDKDDPVLGFFHNWVKEFAIHFQSITVICLGQGRTELPSNVKVVSLGKEKSLSRGRYILNFYKAIWRERSNYEAVFVHMNQEYIVLGGLIWKLLGKRMYLWRNHPIGNYLTRIAMAFSTKVFCTSEKSFTAMSPKKVIMPVGVNTDIFRREAGMIKAARSILFLGRIAPIKKPDLLIEALVELNNSKVDFSASIYGQPLPKDQAYYHSLQELVRKSGLGQKIKFYPGLPNEATIAVYNSHEIFVNLTPSGSYDKTIFEAMACQTLVLASNKDLAELVSEAYIFREGDRLDLESKLKSLLAMSEAERIRQGQVLRSIVEEKHSLKKLAEMIEENVTRCK
ncbi:MAG: glycosyltransferase family 4 protein, partial [Candidatus Paceibacterota bacterium]